MRHPMLRGLTIVLVLSLATTPTPSFALRAGLEGKTERKIASALAPAPVAATPRSVEVGLEESFRAEPVPVATGFSTPPRFVYGNDALIVTRPLSYQTQEKLPRVATAYGVYQRSPDSMLFRGDSQRFNNWADVIEGPIQALAYLAPSNLLITASLSSFQTFVNENGRGWLKKAWEWPFRELGEVQLQTLLHAGVHAMTTDRASTLYVAAGPTHGPSTVVGINTRSGQPLPNSYTVQGTPGGVALPIHHLATSGKVGESTLTFVGMVGRQEDRSDVLEWVEVRSGQRHRRVVEEPVTIHHLARGWPDRQAQAASVAREVDVFLLYETAGRGRQARDRLVALNPVTGQEQRFTVPKGLIVGGQVEYDTDRHQLLFIRQERDKTYSIVALPIQPALTGLEEQVSEAAAPAPRLDYEQGLPLNTIAKLKALRPNDYLGWRTTDGPSWLRYRRVVESWTQDHPAISLKQVNGLGQDINVGYPSVEWPLDTLLALAPRRLTLTTGLNEGQTYRLTGTEGRAFLEALLTRGDTVDVKLMESPVDAHNTNIVRLRLGQGPGDLVFGERSGTRLVISDGDRLLVTATGDPKHRFDITWVATGGMADPDSAQIVQGTRPATAEELLRTGLEETSHFGLTMSVDRSVTSALQAANARLEKLPELIRNAHEQILTWDSQWMPRAEVEAAAAKNAFLRIGAEWQEDPSGHPEQIRIVSRLGPYTMPEQLLTHPEQLQRVQAEVTALEGRFAAEGAELERVDHLGMGGSAAIGEALQRSGLLRHRPGMVVQTSDRSVWRALLPDVADAIVEYLKTTHVEPMSMGMTSEEPVILLAYYAALCRELKVPLDPRLEMLTLKNSSVYQFAKAQGMEHRLIPLQPDGRETAAGRMSGPTATKFPLRFLALNGIDLVEWVRAADLSPSEQQTFLQLGTTLAILAEQGKNKVTLMLPKALAFLAPWLKQLFEESLGRQGKGPLSPQDPNVPFKVVIDEPLDSAFYDSSFYRPAAESDRVFLTIQTDDAKLSLAQVQFLAAKYDEGHQHADLQVKGLWANRLAGLFQGGEVMLAGIADRWGLRFINQPRVEDYKRIAKLMVIEVMRAGGYLEDKDFLPDGTVKSESYFAALPRWILRQSPTHVDFAQTEAYRKVLQPETLGTDAQPLPAAVEGQVHVAYEGLAPDRVEAQVAAMSGSMTSAVDVVRAILALKQPERTTGPVMGGTFRPTPVIAHYGDLQHTKDGQAMALLLQGAATRWFRRPWQVDVDVNEGPRYNHATHEMEMNDPKGVTVILLPLTTPDSPIVSMSDDYRVIQALATYEALQKAGRTVILVTYPQNNADGRAALAEFVRQAAPTTGLEEGRLDYAAGTEITPEILKTLPRGAYVGLLQDGQPRYYQLVMRSDSSPFPAQRTLDLQPVDEAGYLLDTEGRRRVDKAGQPITTLEAMVTMPQSAFLAAAPRKLELTTGLEEGPEAIHALFREAFPGGILRSPIPAQGPYRLLLNNRIVSAATKASPAVVAVSLDLVKPGQTVTAAEEAAAHQYRVRVVFNVHELVEEEGILSEASRHFSDWQAFELSEDRTVLRAKLVDMSLETFVGATFEAVRTPPTPQALTTPLAVTWQTVPQFRQQPPALLERVQAALIERLVIRKTVTERPTTLEAWFQEVGVVDTTEPAARTIHLYVPEYNPTHEVKNMEQVLEQHLMPVLRQLGFEVVLEPLPFEAPVEFPGLIFAMEHWNLGRDRATLKEMAIVRFSSTNEVPVMDRIRAFRAENVAAVAFNAKLLPQLGSLDALVLTIEDRPGHRVTTIWV